MAHSLEQMEIWLQSQSCGQIAELFRWRWGWWRPWSWVVKIWQFSNIYLKLEPRWGPFVLLLYFASIDLRWKFSGDSGDSRICTRIRGSQQPKQTFIGRHRNPGRVRSEQSWWWILWRWWLTIFHQLPKPGLLPSLNKWLQLQWILSRKVFQDTSDPFFNWSRWS